MTTQFIPKYPDDDLPDALDAEYATTHIICGHCRDNPDCGGRCQIYNRIYDAYMDILRNSQKVDP
jgi:hypothetical protein